MRHGKKFNHLSRTAPHRKAMLSNMASSLIMEKRITTTVAKAKALRKYVEPLLTKSKTDDTHSRRVVFSYLQNKESVSELFNEVADKIANRPGGYTRILKTGNRLGDNADMCVIELVDYNEALLQEEKPKKAKTRRSRRGKGGGSAAGEETAKKTTPEVTAEAALEAEATAEQTTEEAAATEAPAAESAEDAVAATEPEATEDAPEAETEAVAAETTEPAATEAAATADESEEPAAEESTENDNAAEAADEDKKD